MLYAISLVKIGGRIVKEKSVNGYSLVSSCRQNYKVNFTGSHGPWKWAPGK
jgi:hypothetical protein